MTKHQLIDALSSKIQLSRRQTENVLSALVDIIGENVKKGEKVSITGFGTFDLGGRAARRGVDPRTGKEIFIPKMAMPRFRAGKRLKELVRE